MQKLNKILQNKLINNKYILKENVKYGKRN